MKFLFTFFLLAGFATAQKTGHQFYTEPYRPQIHFSPKEKWMNDPNGMVYYKGVYHLFYQYYPDSTVWGPMHWGHATSNPRSSESSVRAMIQALCLRFGRAGAVRRGAGGSGAELPIRSPTSATLNAYACAQL